MAIIFGGGGTWIARTPLSTLMSFTATKDLSAPHWAPRGADLSPLDIYVRPQPRKRLKEKDLSNRSELMADVSRALADMRGDSSFLDGVRKWRLIAKKRAKWVNAQGGGIRRSALVM